jgi:hypothetical protein
MKKLKEMSIAVSKRLTKAKQNSNRIIQVNKRQNITKFEELLGKDYVLQVQISRLSRMTVKTFGQVLPLHQISQLVTTPNDEEWLLSKIPSPVVAAMLIYKGSRDGWTMSKFHELCDRMGPTLTIMKTKAGAVCGGFTMQDWSGLGYKSDSCAFVFRLDTKATYSPKLQSGRAIWCSSVYGPSFGNEALSLCNDPMNGSDNGYCWVDKDGVLDTYYKIKADENGKSPLTGEGAVDKGENKYFTCIELEVY